MTRRDRRKTKATKKPETLEDGRRKSVGAGLVMQGTADGLFIHHKGMTIAKRGDPEGPHAGTWVSLEPGYSVRDNADMTEIEVEYKGVRIQ